VSRTTYVYRSNPDGTVDVYTKGDEPQAPVHVDAGALWGDRGYEGLRTTDGVDISSRSKHREYMRRHGLTTADDYKDTWAKAEAAREIYRQGKGGGAVTRNDIAETIARLTGT